MKTETKQSQNIHITIVPHSDAYLRVLRGLQLRVQGHHEVYKEG